MDMASTFPFRENGTLDANAIYFYLEINEFYSCSHVRVSGGFIASKG
jgi:hypothetical protein